MKLLLPWRMPAWLAEVCEGSSAVHLSSRIVVAPNPLRDERHAPGPDLVRQDRVREAVDLDDHHAGHVSDDAVRPPTRQLGHERAVVGLVLVDREDGREDRVEDREDDRSEEG